MDIQRIRSEVSQALTTFALVELHPTSQGGVCVKAGLQTSDGNTYFIAIYFVDYPNRMPSVYMTTPTLRSDSANVHRYKDGNICYLHQSMWNPGRHTVSDVLARSAKWLNKYDVWCRKGRWPGAELKH